MRERDQWAVGIPRRTTDVDPEQFDAAVQEHQLRYGAEVELPGRPDQDEEDGDVR